MLSVSFSGIVLTAVTTCCLNFAFILQCLNNPAADKD